MKHNHKYILDKNSFGRCECGDTKQFPIGEKDIRLRRSETSFIENLDYGQKPDNWLNATLHDIRT